MLRMKLNFHYERDKLPPSRNAYENTEDANIINYIHENK